MIVKDLLDTIGGNTNILIYGTTENDKYVDLWRGTNAKCIAWQPLPKPFKESN